jgi:hypothetical protein
MKLFLFPENNIGDLLYKVPVMIFFGKEGMITGVSLSTIL